MMSKHVEMTTLELIIYEVKVNKRPIDCEVVHFTTSGY
jgi:hypothetical protein